MTLDLDELERLEREAFRAPWTYARWEVECETCASDGECDAPDCDGTHVPNTTIESPEEYPDGQVVAQFRVPGLLSLADKNGALIVALRNAAPALLAAARERDRLAERVARCEAELGEAAGRWLRLAKATSCTPSADAEDRREAATLRDCANELDAIRAALAPAERSEPQLPRVTPEGIVLRPASDYYDTSPPDPNYVPGPRMGEVVRVAASVEPLPKPPGR